MATKPHSLPTPTLFKFPDADVGFENDAAFKQNALQSCVHDPNLRSIKRVPYVEVPHLPPSSQRADYQTVPDSPKRRKLDSDLQSHQVSMHVRAQNEEADAALSKVQDLMLDIFQTQDRLEPDGLVSSIPSDDTYFHDFGGHGLSKITLMTKVHSKLQNAFKRLIEYKRFNDLPKDSVKRIQKLCETSLDAAESLDLRLIDTSDEAFEAWKARVARAENGATSACTIIWTMYHGFDDKELCSEDLLLQLPDLFTNIFENCLIPVVEARSTGQTAAMFETVAQSRDILTRLLHQGKKLLDLLAELSVHMKGIDNVVNAIQSIAMKLIFVENAQSEKESLLGIQNYETVRRTAMEALARIFSKHFNQRSFIFDEILASLEKLPSTKQTARQYKLSDGRSIQLLSALVMQLVQTAAVGTSDASSNHLGGAAISRALHNGIEFESLGENAIKEDPAVNESSACRLKQAMDPLHSNATKSGQYVMNYFVQRAMASTKSGDQPYRNLLDLFTEDLINVLGSADWPASELLLRLLAGHLINIAKDERFPSTAKNMALEQLGWMGSAISSVRASVKQLATVMQGSDTVIARHLSQLAEDELSGRLHVEDILSSAGPYRITIEHLRNSDKNKLYLSSARGFYLMQWAKMVCYAFKFDETADNGSSIDPEINDLAELLCKMLSDSAWFENYSEFEDVSNAQARLAYNLTILNMSFCKLFDHIVMVLLTSINSDQAKMRSRSLKSVISMLDTDPGLLDNDTKIMPLIFRCASDQSPLVRDSALSLIAKCVFLKPSLEEEACKVILACAGDVAIGVRKRGIGLMKDIYMNESRQDLKATIAITLLEKTRDHEESVAGLARQTLQDVWISPLLSLMVSDSDSAKVQVALSENASMIVKAISQNPNHLYQPLEVFLEHTLKNETKTSTPYLELFTRIVAVFFDKVVNIPQYTSGSDREALLLTLTAYVRANPRVVVPDQLRTLRPYIGNLLSPDDLFLFRHAVIIYRCVLPRLSATQQPLLVDIQKDLFSSISRLPRPELNEVMACLWTIDGVLKNTDRLIRTTLSVLKGISSTEPAHLQAGIEPLSPAQLKNIKNYVRIAGCIGKHCDLEKHQLAFRAAFPAMKDGSVAGLIADLVCPLTTMKQQPALRIVALESLGSICQTWPGQFNKEQVRKAFSMVFEENSTEMQQIVLRTFAEFFGIREEVNATLIEAETKKRDQDHSRLGCSLQASDHDGAAALISQHFLKPVRGIAMASQDANALLAIKVIASINRQGLVHPKECAGALVALATSTNPLIAEVAIESHKVLHQQHETMLEREYMRAIHDAFVYQKNVVQDPAGGSERLFQAKLRPLFEIIKSSNGKYVRKFLSNLVSRANFELAVLDVSQNPPEQLLLARFIAHNLGFLDYGKVDELLHVVLHLESAVAKTGADVAQAIETQILPEHAHIDPTNNRLGVTGAEEGGTPQQAEVALHYASLLDGTSAHFDDTEQRSALQTPPSVDTNVLMTLTTAATILTMLWETRTYLRRLYGISSDVRQLIAKNKDNKDLLKTPIKVHGVSGERLWDNISSVMSSLASAEVMINRCRDFVTLITVDNEVKVAADDDDLRDASSASVGPEEWPTGVEAKSTRGRKRKDTSSVGDTPKRKKGRLPANGRRRSSTKLDEDSDWE